MKHRHYRAYHHMLLALRAIKREAVHQSACPHGITRHRSRYDPPSVPITVVRPSRPSRPGRWDRLLVAEGRQPRTFRNTPSQRIKQFVERSDGVRLRTWN
ncbi:uncharacterized protein L3040_007874 [Drepanopeziza brunnea f. sp. 'multigermtubi']|uniref:uncharacterized protein n=1 Tax=Drepanopeziza brunnea f. sp. 'multigermtubi' TaxID=698441 RepID=UPI002395FDB6|nr:hypothetical protein L3040_007874 [Drepanopeziza brunnea f. sp. 'multigermtubi']